MSEQEKALSQKDAQISLLNAKITSVQETADKDIALAVSKAAAQKEKQINEMDRQIYDLTGKIEQTIEINGETGRVTSSGENAFDKTDIWEFPKLETGQKEISFSSRDATVKIKYKPMWI